MTDENKIRDAADAVKGVVDAVPIYKDLVQPAAQEVGIALAKSVRLALEPIAGLVWGWDKIKDFVLTKMQEKHANTPPERVVPPSPLVAGPVLEALRFAGHQPDLAAMYANLLATSMDALTARLAHPAYVDTIRQLSPDEARVLGVIRSERNVPVSALQVHSADPKQGYDNALVDFSLVPYTAGCDHPDLGPMYLRNIARLGLIEISDILTVTDEAGYQTMEGHPAMAAARAEANAWPVTKKWAGPVRLVVHRGMAWITPYGDQFIRACLTD